LDAKTENSLLFSRFEMETHVLLFVVAIVATALNSIAGGGGLLTFPLLMTVLPPVTADATSAVALLPAYLTSTWAGRKHLAPVRHWFWVLLGPSLLGSLVGALLLNWSGNRSFTALIPWLILIATLLTLRPLLERATWHSSGAAAQTETSSTPTFSLGVGAGVLLYGGYFGAGIGILVIGTLDLIGLADIHSILPLKNALCGALRAVAVTVFLIQGEVDWKYGFIMAAGALVGGYIGGNAVRWVNRTMVRMSIVVLGFAIAAYYFWRMYGTGLHLVGSD
jgi:uncharacterized membrane protein YfcA